MKGKEGKEKEEEIGNVWEGKKKGSPRKGEEEKVGCKIDY